MANVQKYIKRHFALVENLKDLTALPIPNESIHIVTMNRFNAWTFIPYLLEKQIIKNLIVSTYAISITVIMAIANLINKGLILNCDIVISNIIVKRKPEVIKQLILETKRYKNYNWCAYKTHAKVTLIETSNNFYVIEGSGNFNENAKIEQYVIVNSKELFHFHKKWIYDIIQKQNK